MLVCLLSQDVAEPVASQHLQPAFPETNPSAVKYSTRRELDDEVLTLIAGILKEFDIDSDALGGLLSSL